MTRQAHDILPGSAELSLWTAANVSCAADTAGFLSLEKLHWKDMAPTRESHLWLLSKGRRLEACFSRLCGWCWPSCGVHTRAGLAYRKHTESQAALP